MTLPFLEPPQSICILRLSAIGDVVHTVPIIRTLQRHWPACKITWIVGRLEASLVGDIPDVEFIIFDKQAGLKGLLDLHRQLSKRRFDLLLHMQVALRASLISLSVHAPLKLGFDLQRAHDYQWLFTNHRIDARPCQHVLDGLFGFLEKIGVPERRLEWDIPVPDKARQKIQQYLTPEKPLLVINACSSNRHRNWRNWPADRYAAVVDHAIGQLGMQALLTGGNSEQEHSMAQDICNRATHKPLNLVGQTTLKELLAILNRADVLIAPDTGPAHMATAVGTPVIGLYATSNPHRTGPYLHQNLAANYYPQALERYSGKTVEQARWGERVRHPDAMQLIPVDDVLHNLTRIINK
ncbi:MAG: glycosyltransferase family 9 protein [Gammaproteobacteria bacterium]|nr:glycosyltransferase family 9 protein [Gammaproteobacteria bacterium]